MPGRGATATAPPGTHRATPPVPRAGASLGLSLRLPAFVAVSTVTGVGGHVATDGAMPHPRLLLLAVVLVGLVALVARGRELRGPGLVALLVAAQAVLHAVLCLCHTGAGLFGTFVHRVLCPVPTSPWADDPLLIAPVHHHAHAAAGGYLAHLYPGHAMLVAHLAAALVTGWWLARGEAAVWRAARTVVPLLRSLSVVPAPVVVAPTAPRPTAAAALLVPLRDQVLARSLHPHRGPPPVFA